MASTGVVPYPGLAGRRALVTGAGRGIGAEIAAALAASGVDLVLNGRDPAQLAAAAASLAESHGVRTAIAAADLSRADEVEELARQAVRPFDGLDILVNNAGISYPEMAVDVTVEHWDAVMAVNLRAPALLASRIGRAMADAGSGRIVNIASAAGLRALPEHYGYCVSKAGLVMATKVLALELGRYGVRANVVCPTVILTEMGQRVWGPAEKSGPMLARIPVGHFGVPADVAHAVLYLASPAADMVNGVELPVDGGYGIA
jgi:NAD(P)-dependent dehydrogenase (short-subunit alcohol dehydrogenase family)